MSLDTITTLRNKLIRRILKESNKLGIVRHNVDSSLDVHAKYKRSSLTYYTTDLRCLDMHYNWVIDDYLLLFNNRIDNKELKSVLEFLDSENDDSIIVGMTMLYNLKIKSSINK